MRDKKMGSSDQVPGRSWKQRRALDEAALMLSDEVPLCLSCPKAIMTPPEGACRGIKTRRKEECN